MTTLIIEMDGGLVNEVYSTLWSRSTFQVYDTDDRRDPEHAYLYAASTYALQFGGMRPQFRRAMTTLTGFGGAGAPARVRCPSLRPAAGRFPGRDPGPGSRCGFPCRLSGGIW